MNISPLDIGVIAVYLIGITSFYPEGLLVHRFLVYPATLPKRHYEPR